MVTSFFTVLLLVSFLTISIYNFFNDKKNLIQILILTLFSLVLVNIDWYYSLVSILFLIFPIIFIKNIPYSQLTAFCMIGSILFAYFLLNFFLNYTISYMLPIAIFSILFMCILSINGLFEDNLKKYLIYSNAIQLMFVLLDLIVAKLSGKISTLGTIQIFNYTFAGLLFFLSIGILSKNNRRKNISKLQASYYRNKFNSIFAIIAAISLAGVPGLNIFVSEWLLFKTSFAISPVITIFGIFIALLLFIMYFKVIYVLIVGESKVKEITPNLLTGINVLLALACIIFGLLPGTQFLILNMVL